MGAMLSARPIIFVATREGFGSKLRSQSRPVEGRRCTLRTRRSSTMTGTEQPAMRTSMSFSRPRSFSRRTKSDPSDTPRATRLRPKWVAEGGGPDFAEGFFSDFSDIGASSIPPPETKAAFYLPYMVMGVQVPPVHVTAAELQQSEDVAHEPPTPEQATLFGLTHMPFLQKPEQQLK